MSERFEVGMEVECVDDGKSSWNDSPGNQITTGRVYKLAKIDGAHVLLERDDVGSEHWYFTKRFRRPVPAETQGEIVRYEPTANADFCSRYEFADGHLYLCRMDDWAVRISDKPTRTREELEGYVRDGLCTRTVIRPATPAPEGSKAKYPAVRYTWSDESFADYLEGSDKAEQQAGHVFSLTRSQCDELVRIGRCKRGDIPQAMGKSLESATIPARGTTPSPAPAPVLPRQPHEPETIGMMRPVELAMFRKGQAAKEAAEKAATIRRCELIRMGGYEEKPDKCDGTLAAYRALCCERGGGE